jgi:DNA-binding NtrC family response regulator
MAPAASQPNGQWERLRILVVEDDQLIRLGLQAGLGAMGAEVRIAGTVREGLEATSWPPEVIVLDVGLPDGSGLEIAEAAARLVPIPRVIATSGAATPAESFRLARLSVDEFLPKPYDLDDLKQVVFRSSGVADDFTLASARCVGRLGLIEARDLLRRAMTVQAVSLADGNLTRAAEMLGVTRQAVQHVVRETTPAPGTAQEMVSSRTTPSPGPKRPERENSVG